MFIIQIVLEFQRFKSVKACRPKTRQATVNENSSANSLNYILAIFLGTGRTNGTRGTGQFLLQKIFI
ncbi:MAG: hypothetical protein LBP59_12630 [Planctomycetaceae bacterium]|nr:hypothetical protein [Planctomycetaceae bacterium]